MDFFEGWDAKRRGSDRESAPITAPITGQATAYALAALQGEVENLLAVPIGSGRNDQLNRSAVKMYGLAAAGQIDERTVTDTLGAADGGLEFPATRKTLASARDAVFTRLGARVVPESTTSTREAVPPWERSDDPLDEHFDASLIRSGTGPGGHGAGSSGTTGRAAEGMPSAFATPAGETSAQLGDAEAAYRQLVAVKARDVRLTRDARRLVDDQDAERAFRVPPALLTLTHELEIPDEPIRYLVDELIPSGANVLLTAQYKTGKTTLVSNLARAYADGEQFLGRYSIVPADGRLVIFNNEVDSAMYRRWLRDLTIRETDRVSVLNLRGYRVPFTVPHVEDWVVEFLKDRDAAVWIIDPFARAFTGGDENDNGAVGVWVDAVDVIKERAGVDVAVVPNHTGRGEQEQGEERGRGATRLDDWADVRWLLTKDKQGTRYFRATGRDVDTDEAALAFDEPTRHLTIGGGSRRSNTDRRIREAIVVVVGNLQDTPTGAGTQPVRDGVRQMLGGLDDREFQRVKDDLVREGFVTEDGHRNRGFRYRLTSRRDFDPLAD